MKKRRIHHDPTFATLMAWEERFLDLMEREILDQQLLLRKYIARDPGFLHSLRPREVEQDAPEIVKTMAEAAGLFGVGPMAAVAGAIAQKAVEAALMAGACEAVVDNGGDIVMSLQTPLLVGLFAGSSPVKGLAFKCPPREGIFSLCTSSGTIGHSLSFGCADAATVVASSGALADAAATALGNTIKDSDPALLQEAVARFPLEIVEGALVVCKDHVAFAGTLPKLVRATFEPAQASSGWTVQEEP